MAASVKTQNKWAHVDHYWSVSQIFTSPNFLMFHGSLLQRKYLNKLHIKPEGHTGSNSIYAYTKLWWYQILKSDAYTLLYTLQCTGFRRTNPLWNTTHTHPWSVVVTNSPPFGGGHLRAIWSIFSDTTRVYMLCFIVALLSIVDRVE